MHRADFADWCRNPTRGAHFQMVRGLIKKKQRAALSLKQIRRLCQNRLISLRRVARVDMFGKRANRISQWPAPVLGLRLRSFDLIARRELRFLFRRSASYLSAYGFNPGKLVG